MVAEKSDEGGGAGKTKTGPISEPSLIERVRHLGGLSAGLRT